ncbi:MAG TPA: A/G-specific adenine glycosylase [Terriglobales bacterium]|nr:A/G-specific adenine glycosylase [Terriglobales bacterium]
MKSKHKPKPRVAVTKMFLEAPARQAFRRGLLSWYERHRRDLPWRRSRDPYRIWVSEVMLQQTRVSAVLDYYERFLRQFPDMQALAAAPPDAVLAAWSGLGYYRRARALHAAARLLVAERGGAMPRSAAELRELPGFGPYTAAAVASIAFSEPVAVVDGNVERVLARLLGWRKLNRDAAWKAAQDLLAPRRPGDFNQAIMELGATVCLPGRPQCDLCPVFRLCKTRGSGPQKPRERRQRRRLHYRLAWRDGAVWLVQRPRTASLMAGMWELPELPLNGTQPKILLALRHSITITDFAIEVSQGAPPADAQGRWIAKEQMHELPITGLTKKILRRTNFI